MNWYGQFKQTEPVTAKVVLRLPQGAESKLQPTVAEQAREVVVKGAGDDQPVTADFGTFNLAKTGYQRFALASLNARGQPFGDLDALLRDGPAVGGAHFNLKERRNAASVHLAYPVPAGTNLAAFYCEVTALEDPTASFSHDPTGRNDRLDRFMGVENGQFFLSHGGFLEGFTRFGDKFTRPPTRKPPSDMMLPPVT